MSMLEFLKWNFHHFRKMFEKYEFDKNGFEKEKTMVYNIPSSRLSMCIVRGMELCLPPSQLLLRFGNIVRPKALYHPDQDNDQAR